jgi:hypothetical protein
VDQGLAVTNLNVVRINPSNIKIERKTSPNSRPIQPTNNNRHTTRANKQITTIKQPGLLPLPISRIPELMILGRPHTTSTRHQLNKLIGMR